MKNENMIKRAWQNEKIKVFVDEMDTVYVRGPFEVDGIKYDYKLKEGNLTDESHVDYCNEEQLIEWGIVMRKDLTVFAKKD